MSEINIKTLAWPVRSSCSPPREQKRCSVTVREHFRVSLIVLLFASGRPRATQRQKWTECSWTHQWGLNQTEKQTKLGIWEKRRFTPISPKHWGIWTVDTCSPTPKWFDFDITQFSKGTFFNAQMLPHQNGSVYLRQRLSSDHPLRSTMKWLMFPDPVTSLQTKL